METDPRQTLQFFLMAIKIAFPLLAMAVIIVLATIENRKYRRDQVTFRANLRRFPKSEAERIAEFRQKYVPRVARR